MVRQLSYTKYENEILPELRQKLNQAESTEDVKKFFTQTIRVLFEKIYLIYSSGKTPNWWIISHCRLMGLNSGTERAMVSKILKELHQCQMSTI